jgi:hypothetical protein
VELVVALIIVLGLGAVAARFLLRSEGSLGLELPQIVDDSVGMYLLRRITGRPLGDRRLPRTIPADPPAAVARPFSAATAKRLGIPRASDVAPRRGGRADAPAAGAVGAEPGPSTQPRRRLGPLGLGLLAAAAIVAGLALGAALAVLVPANGAVGGTGGATAPASPPASAEAPSAAP